MTFQDGEWCEWLFIIVYPEVSKWQSQRGETNQRQPKWNWYLEVQFRWFNSGYLTNYNSLVINGVPYPNMRVNSPWVAGYYTFSHPEKYPIWGFYHGLVGDFNHFYTWGRTYSLKGGVKYFCREGIATYDTGWWWLEHEWMEWLSIQLGMSSSQLTKSYFSEGFV